MIEITVTAQTHFRHLLQNQGSDAVGIRVSALNPGTATADARLEFAEQGGAFDFSHNMVGKRVVVTWDAAVKLQGFSNRGWR